MDSFFDELAFEGYGFSLAATPSSPASAGHVERIKLYKRRKFITNILATTSIVKPFEYQLHLTANMIHRFDESLYLTVTPVKQFTEHLRFTATPMTEWLYPSLETIDNK